MHTLALLSLAVAASGQAFSFGGFTAADEITFATDGLARCVGTEAKGSCALEQESFGGVRIEHSIVSIRDRHLYALIIHGAGHDFDDAVTVLKAKYGEPSRVNILSSERRANSKVWNYNWYFVDGVLSVSRDGSEPMFSFVFASNRPIAPKVDF